MEHLHHAAGKTLVLCDLFCCIITTFVGNVVVTASSFESDKNVLRRHEAGSLKTVECCVESPFG